MARGNQRDKAREKNLKAAAEQKKKTSMSGSEFQREKDKTAALMREKQAKAEARKAEDSGQKKE